MKSPSSAPVTALVALVLIWGYSWVVMKIGLRMRTRSTSPH
jgi:hypothetical protein